MFLPVKFYQLFAIMAASTEFEGEAKWRSITELQVIF